jgi:hypothetical protein
MKLPYVECKKVNCWYCDNLYFCEIWKKIKKEKNYFLVTTGFL